MDHNGFLSLFSADRRTHLGVAQLAERSQQFLDCPVNFGSMALRDTCPYTALGGLCSVRGVLGKYLKAMDSSVFLKRNKNLQLIRGR